MAQRIIHQLIDDIDGTEIVDGKGGAVEFSLRGTAYRIDLNDHNIAKLEKALVPYIEAAAKVSGGRGRERGPKASGGSNGRLPKEQLDAIRHWATANGLKVSARGRIPADVVEAYETSHAR